MSEKLYRNYSEYIDNVSEYPAKNVFKWKWNVKKIILFLRELSLSCFMWKLTVITYLKLLEDEPGINQENS